jgi:predicted Zn-dependent protease
VNHVAQLIVDSSEYYDLPVSVHIASTDKIFANATPIGVIVISQGMLKILRNESELACLLAHEISHVTLGHGSIETTIRKPKFAADDAFAELGDELGVDEVEKELDDMCVEMYERAIKGRTAEYESEADLRGLVYAKRAGYDPGGMVALLTRLKTLIPVSRNPEDRSHWLPSSIDKRIMIAKKATHTDQKYLKFTGRFLQHVR